MTCDFCTYRIGENNRLRQVCEWYAQSHQSLHVSHLHSMEIDEDSDQNLDVSPRSKRQHGCVTLAFAPQGGTLIFSYIRRLGSYFWVQKF